MTEPTRGDRTRALIARMASREVADGESLGDLGLDSLDAVDLAIVIEDDLAIELADELDAITPAMTVADVVRLVEAAADSQGEAR